MMGYYQLFSGAYWYEFSESIIQRARNTAIGLKKDDFDANSKDQIVDHITSTFELSPLYLRLEEKSQNIEEVKIDMPNSYANIQFHEDEYVEVLGYRVTAVIPYDGPEVLFEVQPSTSTTHRFSAKVFNGQLVFFKDFEQSSSTADSIRTQMDREIGMYNVQVGRINNDLTGFNSRLKSTVQDAVDARYDQIAKLDSIKSALKIPLEKTSNPSSLNQVKVTVKKIAPLSTKPEDPGAYISDNDYEHILDSMRSAGASMETNRATEFHDEEALRDVMLVVLSGSIKSGIAGGELFHKEGKTDISIPFDNKATFVAECKLWQGQKYVGDGVNQLLSYTTWRDVKTALVIFNKDNVNFSAIQAQIEEIFVNRDDYVRTIEQREGEWRFVLTKPDDKGRQVEIHVLLFDLHKKTN